MAMKIVPGGFVDMGSQQRSPDTRKERRKPAGSGFGRLLEQEAGHKEGPVKLIQLPLSWRIEKDYGPYTLSYSSKDGRFWKEEGDHRTKAGSRAVARFKRDIAEAAAENPDIARKLRLYPELQ